MMPRIQFSYDGGDGGPEDSVPRRHHSSIIRDAFCNPNTDCSPVCCCCGLVPIHVAVKGVVWVAIIFSVWDVSMGIWLLIESSCCVQPIDDESKSTVGLFERHLSKLRGAGWVLILVGLFRLIGLTYLLYSVSSQDRARRLPTLFFISISILIGLILTYPMFITVPGKGLKVEEGSHLEGFSSAYSTLHTLDLVIMTCYSLYAILYYIVISNHNHNHNLNTFDCDDDDDRRESICRRTRFEPIDTNVRLA